MKNGGNCMLKSKVIPIVISVVTLISASCMCASANSLSDTQPIHNTALFWEEQEAPNCKFYANINGVVRECTREEYALYGVRFNVKINGSNVVFNQKEYNDFLSSGTLPDSIEVQENTIDEKNATNTVNNGDIKALSMMAKWNFTSLVYSNYIDTAQFNFTAGTANNRVSLNLRQWRSSGSTNEPTIRYQVLQLDSNGLITGYYGEKTLTEYVPNSSGYSAYQIQFPMYASTVNNLIVRVTSKDNYNVSGFGEIYNY